MSIRNTEKIFDKLNDEFVSEIRELLDSVEPDFLAMEKSGDNVSPELINRAFRAIHSIKGSAGFGGFDALRALSHALENVLVKIRDGEMRLDADKTDAMLAAMDKLRIMADNIYASNNVAHTEELARLEALVTGNRLQGAGDKLQATDDREQPATCNLQLETCNLQPATATHDKIRLMPEFGAELGNPVFNVGKEEVKSAIADAMYIFALAADAEACSGEKKFTPEAFSKELNEYGRCLYADVHEKSDLTRFYHFIFATILEPEFITQLLGIPKEQIYRFERTDLLAALEQPPEMSGGVRGAGSGVRGNPPHLEPQTPDPVFKISRSARNDNREANDNREVGDNRDVNDNREANDNREVPVPPVASYLLPRTPDPHIRVSVELIDKLMNLVGEMVLGRNQLHRSIAEFVDEHPHVNPLVQNLNVVISEIQENVMQMRMQPVAYILNKFPRIVRDLSRQISKKAELVIEGGAVELDKSILEGLSNPLTHIVRNCLDHGIELPEERERSGKPAHGQIRLKAFHEGGQVHITVTDDGRGIDAEKVAEKAISKGMLTYHQMRRMSENEKLNLIFLPGISTAETVTDISGRGVGMDVVKTNISRLGGHIECSSTGGQGTTVHIIIPLTLAIIPSLIVGVGKCRFAIPQINVAELVCIKAGDPYNRIEKVAESDVLRLRGRLLPIVSLGEILAIQPTFIHPDTGEELPDRRRRLSDRRKTAPLSKKRKEMFPDGAAWHIDVDEILERRLEKISDRRRSPRSDIYIVVLRAGTNVFGLHVNYLFDNEEIVVKPLSAHIKDALCFSGATIMGDGRVAMILDAAGIAAYAGLRFGELEAEERRRKAAFENRESAALLRQKKHREPVLIFNNAAEEYFALALAGISRLELTQPDKIERVGEQEFLFYQGSVLPLIRLEKLLPVSPLPENLKELYVIIPKTSRNAAGILSSRILDTVNADVSVKRDATTTKGFLGTAFIDKNLVSFLNTEELLDLFEEEIRSR
jgi:two-component system chemotaxis sensor kinase CheA